MRCDAMWGCLSIRTPTSCLLSAPHPPSRGLYLYLYISLFLSSGVIRGVMRRHRGLFW